MERRDFFKKSLLLTAGGVLFASTKGALGNIIGVDVENGLDSQSNKKGLKIVVLTGSPRRNGNSAHLAEQFIKGATESGHEIFRFDCAFQKVAGCAACDYCKMDGPCVIKDDFELVRPHLITADMIVFATPMYYFGMSSQLKSVIDRFYALTGQIRKKYKKTAFLMTYSDTSPEEAEPMLSHYRNMIAHMGWEDAGTVVAPGVGPAGAVKTTGYGEEAYRLGKNV